MESSVKYDGLFHISDWFPTIMRLAQLDPGVIKAELDGKDHSGENLQNTFVSKAKARNLKKCIHKLLQ